MGCRVLVVDDEPGYCELLRRVVEKEGCNVTATTCGAQAMAILQAGKVDLLITDVDMPEWNGFDLVELAGSLTRPPAILLITAQKVLLANFGPRMRRCQCLLKPFELADLRAKLALLRNFRMWGNFGNH